MREVVRMAQPMGAWPPKYSALRGIFGRAWERVCRELIAKLTAVLAQSEFFLALKTCWPSAVLSDPDRRRNHEPVAGRLE